MLSVVQQGDKAALAVILRDFKEPNGLVKYESVLQIPVDKRIPALAKEDYTHVLGVITAALTLAFESMNLKRGMNAIQILDLAEAIIDTSHEDNLGVEDLMLFLQKLVRGEYNLYESMDVPKFMKMFEDYRQERHQALVRHKQEMASQHKVQGDTGRTTTPDELSEHFASMGDRLSQMKNTISDLKEQNKNLKIDNL